MPPRHTYWTIILEGKPTAFRSHTQEELLPTLKQLQAKHPDAVMKWFARGKLWHTPEEERMAFELKRASEKRPPKWRPGGEHRDPREQFKIPRDEKRRRFAANLRRPDGPGRRSPGSDKPGEGGAPPRPPFDDRDQSGPGRRSPGFGKAGEGGPKRPWTPRGRPQKPGERPPWRKDRPEGGPVTRPGGGGKPGGYGKPPRFGGQGRSGDQAKPGGPGRPGGEGRPGSGHGSSWRPGGPSGPGRPGGGGGGSRPWSGGRPGGSRPGGYRPGGGRPSGGRPGGPGGGGRGPGGNRGSGGGGRGPGGHRGGGGGGQGR